MSAVLLGPTDVRLAAFPATSWTPCPALASEADALPWAGASLIPHADGALAAVADGNRSAVLAGPRVRWHGADWLVSIKGIGARTLPFAQPADVGRGAGRVWAAECWLGEAPYGAQGEAPAARALALTARAVDGTLGGMPICPVLAVAGLDVPAAPWWYRRYRGRFVQEHRLVPSNVRLHVGDVASVTDGADALLDAFGVRDALAHDAFLDRLLATGLAAATLFARTLRTHGGRTVGLHFDDVWLDKDAVVAFDGALCFADLEGLVEVEAGSAEAVADRVRDQLDRTLYEVLAAADAWLRAGERRFGPPRHPEARRRGLAERVALALDADPYARPARHRDRLDLVVRPGGEGVGVPVTIVDLEGP